MILREYIQLKRGNRLALAAAVGVTPMYLSHIAHGKRQPSAKLALAIDRTTGGKVNRYTLRPDLYPVEE